MRDTLRILPWLLIAVALMLPAKAGTNAAIDHDLGIGIAQSISAGAPHVLATTPCHYCKGKPCGTVALGCCAFCVGPSAVTPGPIRLTATTRELLDPIFVPAILDLVPAPDPYPPRPISIS